MVSLKFEYMQLLEAYQIQPSMSRPGCPYDNAMVESSIKTLKQEEVDGRSYRDLAEAKASIGSFIEEIYNRQRLHSALDYLAPAVFETINARPGAAAQQPLAHAATDCP